MDYACTYVPYSETGFFSPLVLDYLKDAKALQPFYTYTADAKGIDAAITQRKNFPVNRRLLVDTLHKQYGLQSGEAVKRNIDSLLDENTYTICTAHQPNLLTGYLYFIYKITHAIKLAGELNELYKDKHFVPVFYMGTEDNDLEELGVFRYNGKKYKWDADGQTGAVGRMNTASLRPLLNELFTVLGPPREHTEKLKEILTQAYLHHDNISDATRYLVNELFGKYGLVILNPDDAGFKNEIQSIMKDDLLNHTANEIVTRQAAKLSEQYRSQAYPRDINLFYLHDQLRERIERKGANWTVMNAGITWTETELMDELKNHPDRFSPNVILRGVLQESILPNVIFIGGGAEVAYWLQLKELFAHYHVFYPVVILRQSVLWVDRQADILRNKMQLDVKDIFKTTQQLTEEYVSVNGSEVWQVSAEQNSIAAILHQLRNKATALDPTLRASADAALAKMSYQLSVLEKKMLRAEKRKHEIELQRISNLKGLLFPGDILQERVENFIEYYTLYGDDFIETLIRNTEPLKNEFLVISTRTTDN